eukprot:10680095-Karenia_brevis.AAC.1
MAARDTLEKEGDMGAAVACEPMKCAGGAKGSVAAAAEHGLGTPQMQAARDTLEKEGAKGAAVDCSAPMKCDGAAKGS